MINLVSFTQNWFSGEEGTQGEGGGGGGYLELTDPMVGGV